MVLEEFTDHQNTVAKVIEQLILPVEKACTLIMNTLKQGNKVLLAGNGGSAADAQHIAAELCGRFVNDRRALAGIALTTDTSVITSIANDFGYEYIFSRQLEAIAQRGDLFIAISTSGNSKSILNAIKSAQNMQCITLGLSGKDGGAMKDLCDLNIIVPSEITARIQEVHILIGHILCKSVDDLT